MGWAAYAEARSKTLEADVDDRSAIQRQDLGNEEPTCDGQRCSQLRARPPTKGQRKRPEPRSEGGHHDWPEAEQSR